MDQKAIIGVDVGGTKIMTGAITPEGKIIGKPFTIPTGGTDKKEAILGRIFESIDYTLKENNLSAQNVSGIGVGCTGPLDVKNGKILECPQLPDLHFYPLRDAIQDKYKIPVELNNDANALILGESLLGAGRGNNTVLGFTLGTGLGCAIVINKRLHLGSTESAGEVWISPYKNETIEDVVSGAGVSKLYHNLTGKKISSKEIAEIARAGNQEAIAVWKEFGKAVAFAMSWSVNLIDPDVVILGGSIANALDLFSESMEENLRKQICPVPAGKLIVVRAELGDYAGFIGAASLILQNNF
jgi:glucokinase